MKNQTDLIISIVAFVFAVIICITMAATQRQPASPEAAPSPTLTAVSLPESTSMVQYATALPGGGNSGSGSGFGGGMGMMGAMGGSKRAGGPSFGGMAMGGGPRAGGMAMGGAKAGG